MSFRKFFSYLFIGLLFMFIGNSQKSLAFENCDQAYAKRAEGLQFVVLSIACYQEKLAALKNSSAEYIDNLEKTALSAAWIVLRTKEAGKKTYYIQIGLDSSKKLIAVSRGSGAYWLAVYLSFEAQNNDEGLVLPRNILLALPEIKEKLNIAKVSASNEHGYGPYRVNGIMYMSMPMIVGGDDQVALKDLRLAYEKGADYSINTISYAKILMKLKDFETAKSILHNFLVQPVEKYGAERVPETTEDRLEAARLLVKIGN